MAGYEEQRDALEAAGISVVGASVDSRDDAGEVQQALSFPIAHGVTRSHAEAIGAWWDGKREFIQPSEFLLRDGRIVGATYSTGPVGRMEAADVLRLVEILESRRKKGQPGS